MSSSLTDRIPVVCVPDGSREKPMMDLSYAVPMEETVRAFNHVIEKGWVSVADLLPFTHHL